eukprot:7158453-Prymnesium_polylepis.1
MPGRASLHSAWPCNPGRLPYVPGPQTVGCTLPRGQKWARVQLLHPVCPSNGSYLPSGHGAHAALPFDSAKRPAVQAVGTEEPAAHQWPMRHGMH